jgi:hypothetical protein
MLQLKNQEITSFENNIEIIKQAQLQEINIFTNNSENLKNSF